jgi:hypothetical protein
MKHTPAYWYPPGTGLEFPMAGHECRWDCWRKSCSGGIPCFRWAGRWPHPSQRSDLILSFTISMILFYVCRISDLCLVNVPPGLLTFLPACWWRLGSWLCLNPCGDAERYRDAQGNSLYYRPFYISVLLYMYVVYFSECIPLCDYLGCWTRL